MADLTPVTLLTGFLGAGKTTLLNRLLRHQALASAAVLVNEFGAVGIDHRLVQAIDDSTVLLESGCLCCTLRGDLIRALRALLPRARRGEISRIVIETSGLADPVPVMTTLLRDPAVVAAYRLDAVITVVDAVQAAGQLDRHAASRRQVAVADRIVISKTDLADATTLLPLLAALNRDAPLLDAATAASDPVALLAGTAERRRRPPMVADDGEAHAATIDSLSLEWETPLPAAALRTALTGLLQNHGDHVLRVKGIVTLDGEASPVAIHGVGHLLHDPMRLPPWRDGEDRRSRLVIITDDLPRQAVMDALAQIPAWRDRQVG